MSYDYLLVKAAAGAAPLPKLDEDFEAVMMAVVDAFSGEPIGDLDAVKASLCGLLPALQWQQLKLDTMPHLLAAGIGDWSWSSVGADLPQLGLCVDEDGQVRVISASRVEPAELERIASALGLMVLDEQTLEMLTG